MRKLLPFLLLFLFASCSEASDAVAPCAKARLQSGGGACCDPATYGGPGECVESSECESGYIIANEPG